MADLNTITAAKTADDALRLSGELGHDAYSVRLAYIRLVFGPRAAGGYFNATDRNVAVKFVDAWRAARTA